MGVRKNTWKRVLDLRTSLGEVLAICKGSWELQQYAPEQKHCIILDADLPFLSYSALAV